MINKTAFILSCAAPLALLAVPASAQAQAPASTAKAAAASVTVGATVYDTSGAEVGKIKSVTAPNFVIDTGTTTATLALTSLGTSPKGPVLAMSKADLDAAATRAAADASAALASSIVVGAAVHASDGTTALGKIAEVAEADFVLDTGKTKVKLPKSSVAQGSAGLMIGMTAQEFADATASAGKSTVGK
ncbi:preprotein translocase subunit YajC [Novosphingobium hassiacum]|uniref:Preprotein translocase subunit YajC n=1 Tax=Novosphingobium hassiacum TaxID=173676 RepID=A0A7W5ZXP3_9SPHN|nr:hypothetical protein [Novosphingobium hassiacum]MBB3861144.1 preprotein translocase subunit YajC [Novosphingobium hassiacum]